MAFLFFLVLVMKRLKKIFKVLEFAIEMTSKTKKTETEILEMIF